MHPQIGVGFRAFWPDPSPTPYVDPIPPKVTQCHPWLRGLAEGRKAVKGLNAELLIAKFSKSRFHGPLVILAILCRFLFALVNREFWMDERCRFEFFEISDTEIAKGRPPLLLIEWGPSILGL
jgi:hypothetical protein